MIDEQNNRFLIDQLVSPDPRIVVGQYTYGNPQFFIWDPKERITIGKFCSIAEQVTIFGGGEHNTHWVSTYPFNVAFGIDREPPIAHPASKGPTTIGNDVWLGFNSTILSGVIIGDGAVVAAEAVVTRDVPPYAMVAGNPAKVVRYRFEPCQIDQLLQLGWWSWPIEKILADVDLLCSPNLTEFIEKAVDGSE